MFDRLKRIFGGKASAASSSAITGPERQRIHQWALQQGYSFSEHPAKGRSEPSPGFQFGLGSKIHGKRWRIECGSPDRDFIKGLALRGRMDIGAVQAASIVIMNRPLKVALEKRAYALYTDSVQTAVDPSLPEEMRWLAALPEVAWKGPPTTLFDDYAVLAARREHATAWVDEALAESLLAWQAQGARLNIPFVLMLMRGKCYLRMQYAKGDLSTLQQMVEVFAAASESGLRNLPDVAGQKDSA